MRSEKPKKKNKLAVIPLPVPLFVLIMAVFDEAVLHLWTMENFVAGRFAAVLAFAAAFGGLLALIVSQLPHKAQKPVAAVLLTVLAVLYLVEYYVHDAYQVFMSLGSVLGGAENVATNYLDVVLSLLARSLWRIGLMLLPIVLYCVFARPCRTNWLGRVALGTVALSMSLVAYACVQETAVDASKLSLATSFDGAVESFGLNVAMVMDAAQSSEEESLDFEPSFQIQTPTEAPETRPQDQPEDASEPEETEPVYEEHTLGLDFAALAEAEEDEDIAAIHSYIASLQPAEENEYTGLFEGKNLIVITAEAFSEEVIDPELTPTLYRMANEGIKFTDYYQPVWGCGTTGGEYTNLLSLIPYGGTKSMQEVVEQNMFLTIGSQLQKRGYSSAAFHNNDYTYYHRDRTHTHLGYDLFMGYGNGMEEGVTKAWPQSDQEMFEFTIPQYIDQQPFSLYYMTVSGHATYTFVNNDMAEKNQAKVEDLDYSMPVRAYLACQLEVENAMTSLIAMLEEAGIADDTVVVLATDHYPYGLAPSETWGTDVDYLSELFGERNSSCFIRDKSALIIWSGCLEGKNIVVDTPTMSLDILPTLSNLFGVEYDSRLMCGRDVFSDQQAVAYWQKYSWKTEKGTYDSSTGKFTPVEGVEVDENYVSEITAYVKNKFVYSKAVAREDYFNVLTEALDALNGPQETEAATEEPTETAPE